MNSLAKQTIILSALLALGTITIQAEAAPFNDLLTDLRKVHATGDNDVSDQLGQRYVSVESQVETALGQTWGWQDLIDLERETSQFLVELQTQRRQVDLRKASVERARDRQVSFTVMLKEIFGQSPSTAALKTEISRLERLAEKLTETQGHLSSAGRVIARALRTNPQSARIIVDFYLANRAYGLTSGGTSVAKSIVTHASIISGLPIARLNQAYSSMPGGTSDAKGILTHARIINDASLSMIQALYQDAEGGTSAAKAILVETSLATGRPIAGLNQIFQNARGGTSVARAILAHASAMTDLPIGSLNRLYDLASGGTSIAKSLLTHGTVLTRRTSLQTANSMYDSAAGGTSEAKALLVHAAMVSKRPLSELNQLYDQAVAGTSRAKAILVTASVRDPYGYFTETPDDD